VGGRLGGWGRMRGGGGGGGGALGLRESRIVFWETDIV